MAQVIKGTISSYIYKSDDSLYKVAKILTNENEEIIIVGSFIELEEGLEYEFVGEFVEHSKYGKQFKIDSYAKSNSFSKDGLIAYLSSDKFFGIGPKLAANIVDELGLDCINKIITNPDCLDSVYLMNENKKNVLYETLKENYAMEQVILKLYSFGLSDKMVVRLINSYGYEAATKIEENPYSLIYDIDGFGFKRSDELALRLGFKENDLLRLKEALKYTLSTVCYQQGFTFLTFDQLINSSHTLLKNSLNISKEELVSALNSLETENRIIKEDENYFDYNLYKAEINCSSRLKKIKDQKIKFFSKQEIEEAIEEVSKDININYTDLQKEAITKTLMSKLSIITGGPGTGKSTIINGILRTYAKLNKIHFPSDELDMKVSMMAPTGRAAKRMNEISNFKATTIHKALGYNYEEGFSVNENSPLNCSLAIIDEASMIDISLASALFSALPSSCQIIMVGDENQLPSVGPGNVFHDLIASNLFTVNHLYEVLRQAKESNIVKLANMVQAGFVDYRIFSEKKEVYFYNCDTKNTNEMITKIIDSYVEKGGDLKQNLQILVPMYAGVAGIDAINEKISSRYNHSDEKIVRDNLIIKTNDKVLQLKNDPTLKLMNGDIGFVKAIAKIIEKDFLLIDFDGKIIEYPAKEMDSLRLAYAISIHKSQGSGATRFVLKIYNTY